MLEKDPSTYAAERDSSSSPCLDLESPQEKDTRDGTRTVKELFRASVIENLTLVGWKVLYRVAPAESEESSG